MEIETGYFNEVFEPGSKVRERYRPLFEVLEGIGEEEFAARSARSKEKLRELGATFPLPDDPEGQDRILPADWIPRIIPKDHREILSVGLLQRGYAINAWLTDLYNGEQDVVPKEIVESSVLYRPGPVPDHSVPVHVYGPDVVQLGPKEYVVLEDNVRVPSGVAYSEAIRRYVDLRVDEHPDPIAELRRIYEVFKVQMLPFVEALPTRVNPKGDFGEEIRGSLIPADDLPHTDGKAPEEDVPPPQDLQITPQGS